MEDWEIIYAELKLNYIHFYTLIFYYFSSFLFVLLPL